MTFSSQDVFCGLFFLPIYRAIAIFGATIRHIYVVNSYIRKLKRSLIHGILPCCLRRKGIRSGAVVLAHQIGISRRDERMEKTKGKFSDGDYIL
jgi:hypothetical protein